MDNGRWSVPPTKSLWHQLPEDIGFEGWQRQFPYPIVVWDGYIEKVSCSTLERLEEDIVSLLKVRRKK